MPHGDCFSDQGQLRSESRGALCQVCSSEAPFMGRAGLGGGAQGENQKYEEEMDWEKTKKLVRIRTNIFMIMQVGTPRLWRRGPSAGPLMPLHPCC